MELELGLALPGSSVPSKRHGFDLNGVAFAAAGVHPSKMKKRGFDEAFGSDNTTATLPLFVWRSASDDEEKNNSNNRDGRLSAKDDHNNGAEATSPVGWPPVKSAWRNAGGTRHVKVKMEGVAIGRKVDLSLHGSYATLLDAVDHLFTRNHHEDQEGHRPAFPLVASPAASRPHRTFTYQVGNGDWMLLGDSIRQVCEAHQDIVLSSGELQGKPDICPKLVDCASILRCDLRPCVNVVDLQTLRLIRPRFV
ncbi:hypothetical protein Taro_030679 [Colocasia esculenta]|uniref:Auxin-responsive protein n=1 Tax=Colocasia esculenta TaxID=4460 RepID=A0A843VWU1_COLES|nr:hypothetical protein [Colocasia esculenta]